MHTFHVKQASDYIKEEFIISMIHPFPIKTMFDITIELNIESLRSVMPFQGRNIKPKGKQTKTKKVD